MTSSATNEPGTTDRGWGGQVGGRAKRLLRRLDQVQRRHVWLAFPYAVLKKFGDDSAGQLAAVIAYYGFFSLFPLLLVMVTVLGYLLSGNEAFQQRVLDSTLAQFPVIGDQIRANVDSIHGSGAALLFGTVAALWAGLAALEATGTAMNNVWNVPIKHRPSFLQTRLRALAMVAVLGGGMLLAAVLGSAGTFSRGLGAFEAVVGVGLSLTVATGVFLLGFKVLTDRHLSWRELLPGALVGGVGWGILHALGGFYVGELVRGASQIYGFFAIVIGLLAWMYLQAQVALFAAEVNVLLGTRLWPRTLSGENLTDADVRALQQFAKVEERRHGETVTVDLHEEQPRP